MGGTDLLLRWLPPLKKRRLRLLAATCAIENARRYRLEAYTTGPAVAGQISKSQSGGKPAHRTWILGCGSLLPLCREPIVALLPAEIVR